MAPRPDKVAKVDEIAEKLDAAGTVLVAEYRHLDVPAQAELRAAVTASGGEFKIYKNTLTRLAAERSGVDIGEHLGGPTALAFAYGTDDSPADPVGLSKALTEFAKTNPGLVVRGGIMDGAPIGLDEVTALSKVPPREEMLAQFAGLLQAPMSKFAALLQAMPTNFAGLVKALIDKGGAGEPEAPAPAAEAADEAAADDAAPVAEEAAESADAAEAQAQVAEETDASDDAPEAAAEDAAADKTDESADADSDDPEDKED